MMVTLMPSATSAFAALIPSNVPGTLTTMTSGSYFASAMPFFHMSSEVAPRLDLELLHGVVLQRLLREVRQSLEGALAPVALQDDRVRRDAGEDAGGEPLRPPLARAVQEHAQVPAVIHPPRTPPRRPWTGRERRERRFCWRRRGADEGRTRSGGTARRRRARGGGRGREGRVTRRGGGEREGRHRVRPCASLTGRRARDAVARGTRAREGDLARNARGRGGESGARGARSRRANRREIEARRRAARSVARGEGDARARARFGARITEISSNRRGAAWGATLSQTVVSREILGAARESLKAWSGHSSDQQSRSIAVTVGAPRGFSPGRRPWRFSSASPAAHRGAPGSRVRTLSTRLSARVFPRSSARDGRDTTRPGAARSRVSIAPFDLGLPGGVCSFDRAKVPLAPRR